MILDARTSEPFYEPDERDRFGVRVLLSSEGLRYTNEHDMPRTGLLNNSLCDMILWPMQRGHLERPPHAWEVPAFAERKLRDGTKEGHDTIKVQIDLTPPKGAETLWKVMVMLVWDDGNGPAVYHQSRCKASAPWWHTNKTSAPGDIWSLLRTRKAAR